MVDVLCAYQTPDKTKYVQYSSLRRKKSTPEVVPERMTLDRKVVSTYNIMAIGAWRSLVSRLVRVQEAPGSNPGAPTMKPSC